ncbi:hypothetical protein SM764_17065 [Pseudophaeobacter sp. 1A16562]|uniref:hypothetical protein n=1 Tax=unclassified Pseudophaeobacter TaxID=2637024 RepID=UPI0034D6644D
MTMPEPAFPLDPAAELEMIRWKQARFEEITQVVENALPELMADIEETVISMSTLTASKAQVFPDGPWKDLFEPWAKKTARLVEAQMEKEIGELAASSSEKGTLGEALRVARPALAGAGVLAASLAAIPSVVSLATITTTSFFVLSTTTISWPIIAVGGAGLAVTSFAGSKGVKWLEDKNRVRLVNRLQGRALTATLGHGLAPGERSLVTDLQAATLRRLEAKLESV